LVAPAAAPPPRPRIDRLSIQNYRAFPGTGNPDIVLGGKNLLVYGENGSGKSSVFHALDQFFSVSAPNPRARQKLLEDETNIYSDDGPDKTTVLVQFTGGAAPIVWSQTSHPVDRGSVRSVVAGAYRKAMLDYRALLAVNYKFLGKRINLFEACVTVLLRDLAVPFQGSEKELTSIWRDVLIQFPERHVKDRRDFIDAMLAAINAAMDGVLPPLKDEANRLLTALKWRDLEIDEFEFSHLRCNWSAKRPDRKIRGQKIAFTLEQRGEEVTDPHHLLNEARQSGLALALYLAGRCLASRTMQPDTPKLMVLDDVLVGLDQSNRLPMLDLLKAEFGDWQIVLLTHDRVWFEMARAHLPEADWAGLEMFEGVDAAGNTHPIQRPLNNFDAVGGNLQTARDFLAANHEKAAAVHARMAFEQVLKKFCARKSVPVPFRDDPRHMTTADLLDGMKRWLLDPGRAAQNGALQPKIVDVEAARRVVLNAFSHSTPVTLARAEIENAIDIVEALHAELRAQF
jgi:recombinational DNA repair ATPase RecF